MTSLVNSRVKKIGVSEMRKSAGHLVASFTQRISAAYFSGVKSALNRGRSSECILDRDGSLKRPTYFSGVRAIRASEITRRLRWIGRSAGDADVIRLRRHI